MANAYGQLLTSIKAPLGKVLNSNCSSGKLQWLKAEGWFYQAAFKSECK